MFFVQSPRHVQLFVTPWTAACQAFLSFSVSWNLLYYKSIESVLLSNQLIFCLPLPFPPSIFANIKVFSKELALHIRWPKHWSFSFSIILMGENMQNEGLCMYSFLEMWEPISRKKLGKWLWVRFYVPASGSHSWGQWRMSETALAQRTVSRPQARNPLQSSLGRSVACKLFPTVSLK